ncbi:MAG: hypothetical protein D6738_05210 [Acidobacteria bacterium]|nr:MAG: hypothetical protein D6738_05210 [Acidobacteriota bacterium]
MRAKRIVLACVALCGAPALAGAGAGELALDRGAVASLVAAALPAVRAASLPGVGPVTLELEPPRTVVFAANGVEGDLGVRIAELGLSGTLRLRMVPEVRPADGVVVLRAERLAGQGALAMLPDLAALLPPVELPRTQRLLVTPQGGRATELTISAQGVRVTRDRLVLLFGMATRPAAGTPSSTGR